MHAGTVADIEDDIRAQGAELIWVLEENTAREWGTAEECLEMMDYLGSEQGWCVGDGQTEPEPGVFDDSPFSVDRGFDIVVERDTMEIVFSTSHGSPDGNENPTAEDVLAAVATAATP